MVGNSGSPQSRLPGQAQPAHLVSSPLAVVRVWSPVLPTTTCRWVRSAARACSGPSSSGRHRPDAARGLGAPHQEGVYVHGRVHGDLAPKVVLKLVLLDAAGRLIGQQLGEALRGGTSRCFCQRDTQVWVAALRLEASRASRLLAGEAPASTALSALGSSSCPART